MCSPYLTGSLALMLVLVGFNYWSVSTQNQDLLVKTSAMQQQLRVGSDRVQEMETNYSNLKHEHTIVTDEKSQCDAEKKKLTESCEKTKLSKDSEISRLAEKNGDLLEDIKKLKIECEENSEKEIKLSEEKETMLREREDLIKAKEDLEAEIEKLKTSLSAAESKAADLQGKLSELLNQKGHVNQNQISEVESVAKLPNGQLPDVDPGAVSVIKKDTLGPPGLNLLPEDGQPAGISSSNGNKQQQEESAGQNTLTKDNEHSKEDKEEPKEEDENVTMLMEKALENKEVDAKETIDVANEKVNADAVEEKEDKNDEDIEDLDRQEADSFIPQLENAKEGRKEIKNDDQDPAGDIEESENLNDEEDNVHADLEEVDKMKGDKDLDAGEDVSQLENEDYDGLKKMNSDIEVL